MKVKAVVRHTITAHLCCQKQRVQSHITCGFTHSELFPQCRAVTETKPKAHPSCPPGRNYMYVFEIPNWVMRIKNFKAMMHLRALLGFTAAVRKKQLTVFTLWGFPVAALAFQILRKNVRLHCVNVRVTKKLTARQISPVVMQESCEAGDAIQPGRRVALRDELQGNQRETPRLYLFS